MTTFRDIDQTGRTRPRGLGALIPTEPPTPAVTALDKQFQWKQLNAALFAIRNAEFEYARGDHEAAGVWMDDARHALGALALSLAEGPAADGYARLFETIVTPPQVRRRD
jgi:hypothetical protein